MLTTVLVMIRNAKCLRLLKGWLNEVKILSVNSALGMLMICWHEVMKTEQLEKVIKECF